MITQWMFNCILDLETILQIFEHSIIVPIPMHACTVYKNQRLQHCLMFNYDLLLVLDLGIRYR